MVILGSLKDAYEFVEEVRPQLFVVQIEFFQVATRLVFSEDHADQEEQEDALVNVLRELLGVIFLLNALRLQAINDSPYNVTEL